MQNRYSLNRSIGGAIAVIGLVSVLCSVAVLTTLGQLRHATAARGRSNDVVRAVDAFGTAMLNQETGLRGYLITGEDPSLAPYRLGRDTLDQAIAGLHARLDGDPAQATRLADAERAARAWQADIGEAVIARMADPATRPAALAVERQGEGRRYFDTFRAHLDIIRTAELEALKAQDSFVATAQRNATIALWTATLLTVVICALVALAIQRTITRPLVQLAGAMGRLARRDLETDIPATRQRNEVGAMARAVEVFKRGLIELDRTSLLRVTADALPAMVGYVDAERRVGFLNGEFGRWFDLRVQDVAELQGRPLAQVFSALPFPGTGASSQLDAAFAGHDTRFEARLARSGGGVREVEAFFRPHRGPGGDVLGVVTLLTDITERKHLESSLARQASDLRRSNEELEQFAYVASHDLKAPLRGIENLVSWIEEDLEGALQGDTRTNMDLLKNRVRRLESLLDDLLAYSRAGRTEGVVDTVDTRVLVDELATLVSPPEGFEITGSERLPTLRTARAPFTQVLQNLIGNALKHHDRPAGGHIRVDAETKGAFYEFTVADDGPGIPAQFRDRVFGMFQTLRPRDQVEGSGMGLAVVKKLVERQGGKVWLDGAADDRGLVAHFTWPREARESPDGTAS